MKTLKIITASLSILIGLSSCEKDFLSEPPKGFTAPENFYKTPSDLKTALVGCYDAINTNTLGVLGSSNVIQVADGNYSRGLLYMLGAGNDEVVSANDNIYTDFAKLTYLPSNNCTSKLWVVYYAGIFRCNFLIEKTAGVAMNDADKNKIIAEARFLRAFYYYHLASLFGGVPLNTDATIDGKRPRASLKDVYTFILNDLEFAYANAGTSAINVGGASKWVAAGYLGTVCNYLASAKRTGTGETLNFPLNSFSWVDAAQMTSRAKTVLADVIQNSPYKLVSSADYRSLFLETTKAVQYQETLFLSELPIGLNEYYPELSNFPIPVGSRDLVGGGFGRLRPTRELYNSYNVNDIRRNINITGAIPNNAPTINQVELINNVRYYVPNASNLNSTNDWCQGKFRMRDPKAKSIPTFGTDLSFPLLRLADVMLQYAEALYYTGDEATARTYFTLVRTRVVAPGQNVSVLNNAYKKANFIDELLDERLRELCYENKRRIDLIRFNKWEEKIMALSTTGNWNTRVPIMKSNYAPYKMWLPIPEIEITANPQLVQNPGY